MDNLVRFLPAVLFIAFGVKGLVLPSSLVDASFILISASLFAFFQFQLKNNQIQELNSKIKQLESRNIYFDDKVKEMESHISSIKLTSTARKVY